VIGRRLIYRDGSVDPADLLRIGGVWVTHPVRTLADLARVQDDEHLCAARLLAESDRRLATQSIQWLRTHGSLPNKRSALPLLAGMAEQGRPVAGQEEVTR